MPKTMTELEYEIKDLKKEIREQEVVLELAKTMNALMAGFITSESNGNATVDDVLKQFLKETTEYIQACEKEGKTDAV